MKRHLTLILLFLNVFNTVATAATIQLPATGQSLCYDAVGTVTTCTGTGQDGDQPRGAVWPTPRFTDNANGTVTDNLTGLIWLKDADCKDMVAAIAKTATNYDGDLATLSGRMHSRGPTDSFILLPAVYHTACLTAPLRACGGSLTAKS
jgi:hypothetical protein